MAMSEFVINLDRPIMVRGESVDQLTIREPEGEDLMEIGYPYLIVTGDDKSEAIELRPKIIGRYLVKLANIPPSSVKQLSIADVQKLQAKIMSFFGQKTEGTSSDSSSESST